jgi:membrane protein implicated in regulation of membrane protease activity
MWEAPLIVGVVFFSVVAVVKIVAESRTRNRLIERGMVDERVRDMLAPDREMAALSSLKWGMVLVGIGLAALLSQLFPYYMDSEVAFGLMFIFAGIAFLIYYPIAGKRLKKIEEKRQQREAAMASGSQPPTASPTSQEQSR